MKPVADLKVGLLGEASQEVTPEVCAPHIGSGSLMVYATPAMVALVERTCANMLAAYLPAGHTSVGVEVCVRHLAPTPVGGSVRVRAEIVEISDQAVSFRAQIRDDAELVGEAEHRRAIIEERRFLKRVCSKVPPV